MGSSEKIKTMNLIITISTPTEQWKR